MDHLLKFQSRDTKALSVVERSGWKLKRYAILAEDRSYNDAVAVAACDEALDRMPQAGELTDGTGNHGVGFQIVHFAEVAVVSPVFYWQWGSVLANLDQMRASWQSPTLFEDGVKEVVGCIWEMQLVIHEINAWKSAVLQSDALPSERLKTYLSMTSPNCFAQ